MSYKRIDLTKLGGFPLTQDALDFMQAAYQNAITSLAGLAGNSVIVSGMTDNGTAVTGGWIVYNGELLPFKGGNKQTYFIIEETTGQAQFEDDSIKTVYFTRQARFGSGPGQVAYANLVRLDSIKALQANLSSLSNSLNNLSTALTQHENDVNNPHEVNKSQVGLSNIPNAKSDSYTLNDSDTLATSKAVYDGVRSNAKILYVGSAYIGDVTTEDIKTIYHNQNISGGYIVTGTLRSVGITWNRDNDVWCVVRNLNANTFDLLLREDNTDTQSLYFDYALIKI